MGPTICYYLLLDTEPDRVNCSVIKLTLVIFLLILGISTTLTSVKTLFTSYLSFTTP